MNGMQVKRRDPIPSAFCRHWMLGCNAFRLARYWGSDCLLFTINDASLLRTGPLQCPDAQCPASEGPTQNVRTVIMSGEKMSERTLSGNTKCPKMSERTMSSCPKCPNAHNVRNSKKRCWLFCAIPNFPTMLWISLHTDVSLEPHNAHIVFRRSRRSELNLNYLVYDNEGIEQWWIKTAEHRECKAEGLNASALKRVDSCLNMHSVIAHR